MDRSQLSSLKRPQLQQLARREGLKANSKNVEIIRLLLKKYPDGVPELAGKPSVSKPSVSSPSKANQPARRRKRKSVAKPISVKAEETIPVVHTEPTLDELDAPHRGRDVRSMAPPPVTPSALSHLRSPERRRLPSTPRIDTVFLGQAGGVTAETEDVSGMVRPSESTPTPPEAAPATSHQTRKMLRNLTDIIDTTSLDPEEESSILYRAKAVNAVLDTTIVPRLMKVDKDVKDLVWMRVALEGKLGPRLKEKGFLPDPRHDGTSNVRSHPSFPAPRPPSPKRSREEGASGEGIPPPVEPRASKRTRVQ